MKSKNYETEAEKLVREALENSLDNGYGPWLRKSTVDAIAADLIYCDSELENLDFNEIANYVIKWKIETFSSVRE